MLTPQERTLRARLAAQRLHSNGGTNTVPARAAFNASDHSACRVCKAPPIPADISAEERLRRLNLRKREHFTRLALISARARRKAAA